MLVVKEGKEGGTGGWMGGRVGGWVDRQIVDRIKEL